MHKVIYKYPFEVNDVVEIEMPLEAEVLSVQVQRGGPCIWALVDPKTTLETKIFVVYGTGHPVNTSTTGKFIGTFQLSGGALVFHLFETK